MSGRVPRILSSIGRAIALVALPLIAGCDFDPSEHVHSPTQPDFVAQDGVVWVALKLAGDNDEWFWIPEEAAAATRAINVPEGFSYSLLVNGKAWKITTHKDGTYSYDLIVKIVRPDGLVTILTDGDDAGERCAVSIFSEVAARRRVRWAKIQEGKQPTDCSNEELQAMLSA